MGGQWVIQLKKTQLKQNVAKGFSRIAGEDFNETSSPNMTCSSQI